MVEVEAALYPDKAHGQHMPRTLHSSGLFRCLCTALSLGWLSPLAELDTQTVNAAPYLPRSALLRAWTRKPTWPASKRAHKPDMRRESQEATRLPAARKIDSIKKAGHQGAILPKGRGQPRRKRQRAEDLRCTCDLSYQITALT